MSTPALPYRVYRRRWPMYPAFALGLLQIAVGVDTLFTHLVLPASRSPFTTIAAGAFIILGLVLLAVVSANLFGSPPLIEATAEGVFLGITEPGRPPVRIPWEALKAVEVGRAGVDKTHTKDDPVCLILRFSGARVSRPAKLLGVFHSTRGSFYLRASQLPALDPIVRDITALMRARRPTGRPLPTVEPDED